MCYRLHKVSCAIPRVAALVLFCGCASAGPVPQPAIARSPHFEVYSQSGAVSARSILLAFERLRLFFSRQTGLETDSRPVVRVIVFRSAEEYQPYRLHPAADAYYVGSDTHDSIVMTETAGGEIHVAAHEYAHFALHANGLTLPPWLSEGLADSLAMVRLSEPKLRDRNDLEARRQVLRTQPWMPLAELVNLPGESAMREQRDRSAVFYAQSWALTDMLMTAPEYQPHFEELVAALSPNTPAAPALAAVYGRPLEQIAADLRVWVGKRRVETKPVPALSPGAVNTQVTEVSPRAWRTVLAELLVATGRLERAESAFRELAREFPGTADYSAALAFITLQKGSAEEGRQLWRQALAEGIRDADACYRWAASANAAGLGPDDLRPALERAVILRPEFDDARFMLAHLDNNAGLYEAAVANLLAMRDVEAARQFPYWAALAYAYNELGRREEAQSAAARALAHAATDEERAHAEELSEVAETDVAAQFTRDAEGKSHLIFRRIPHGTQDWNPFIEPQDRIRRVEGKLREIDCSGPTRIAVETAEGSLTMTIPDPQRVEMRNAPDEFVCGLQPLLPVTVVYAVTGTTAGIVRGIEFR